MSAEVMHQTWPAEFDPDFAGSMFSCSRSETPCHHFCLRHSKPLQLDVEEWFMTDEVDIEEEDEEDKQDDAMQSEDDERELMQTGLLDQLLDEAYAHYYEEPDEWDELANWYSTRMNCDEPWAAENQSDESSSGASPHQQPQQEFHPAWRQEEVGTSSPGRFSQGRSTSVPPSSAGSSSHRRQSQPPVGTPSGRLSASAGASTSQGRSSESADPAGHRQQRTGSKRQREWVELVDEQEREERREMLPSGNNPRRRASAGWSETTHVRELELYETFSDLLFPDPESGRL